MKLLAPFLLIVAGLAITVYLDDTPADADLVFVNRGDVFTLDPQRQSYVQDFRMAYALYEGLVRWNNHDFSREPAAAALPERPDDRTYVFRIFPEARWSNGAPVTAHDFVYSWRRLLLPETIADYSNLIFCIAGAEPFWRWRSDQLEAYRADPWAATGDERRDQARAVVRRLRALAGAATPPDGLAMAGEELAALGDVLDAIERAADEDDDDRLAAALDAGGAVREALRRLDETGSRLAETEWMWTEALRRFDETVGITADDDRTLRVTLDRPTAYFLDLVCFGVCSPVFRPCVEGWSPDPERDRIVAASGWAAVEPPGFDACRWVKLDPATGRFEQRHQWARPGRLVSNGPYVLTQWRYKRDLRVERNPMYHRPEIIRNETVVALTIEDANTRVLAFESGKLDWLSEVGAEYQADMLAERRAYLDAHAAELPPPDELGMIPDEALAALPPPVEGQRRNIHVFPTFGTDFYSFNCRPTLTDGRDNPFAKAAVRRAFVLSVDRKAIVERVTRLNEPVATTLIPRGSIEGYRSPEGLGRDVERAQRELASAGWVRRDGRGLVNETTDDPFPVVDLLWTTNTPRYKWISLELKAQWERELGVRIELRPADTKFYKEDLKKGKFMIARGRWYGDYGDPTTFLDLCRTDDGNNDRGYSSPVVDGLLERAAAEVDPEARMRLLEECERVLFDEDVPMLVICQLVQVYMYEPGRLTGLSKHPRLTQHLWAMEVHDR